MGILQNYVDSAGKLSPGRPFFSDLEKLTFGVVVSCLRDICHVHL